MTLFLLLGILEISLSNDESELELMKLSFNSESMNELFDCIFVDIFLKILELFLMFFVCTIFNFFFFYYENFHLGIFKFILKNIYSEFIVNRQKKNYFPAKL